MADSEILSPLRSLQAALQEGRLAAAVRRREHGAALNTASRALESHGSTVDRLEKLARAAAAISTHLDRHSELELRRKLGMVKQRGQALAREITTETLDNSRLLLAEVGNLVDDISTQLQRGWDSRILAEFNTLEQLGQALKMMNAEGDLGERMRGIARKGRALRCEFPPSATTLETLAKQIRARDGTLDELSKSGSGIGTFLLKVANNEATLADLDQDTLDWLRNQNALEALTVRL